MNQFHEKPVVLYQSSPYDFIVRGVSAIVHPSNHPSPRVSNHNMVRTSEVQEIFTDAQGNITGFDTLNTQYRKEG